MEANNNIFSKKVKAGRRTYFVDLKETRDGSFYLVVSESRKNFHESESPTYQKSKVFIYPEDISRFSKAINEAFDEMKNLMPSYDFEKFERRDTEWQDTPNEE